MNLSSLLGVAILLFLMTPFLLYAFGKYRVPASIGVSVRDNLLIAIGGIAIFAALDALDPSPAGRSTYVMEGFALGALLRVALDLYMLRRERLRGGL